MIKIIGISGKMGAGKDTLGKILQVLLGSPDGLDNCLKIDNDTLEYAKWDIPKYEIKKFAESLKDIVCILLGCSKEDLENQEYKKKVLGEEWWYYELKKDGGYGTALYPYLEGKPSNVSGLELVKPTVRSFLQKLGTQCGREVIHPNIWVNSLMSGYKKEYLNTPTFSEFSNTRLYSMPNWIITDVRFPNEYEAIKSREGIVIRIERDSTIENNHDSETSLDSYEFDYVIKNNGNLKDLVVEAKKLLSKLKN